MLSTGLLFIKNTPKAQAYGFTCPPPGGGARYYFQWIGGHTNDGGQSYYEGETKDINTSVNSVSVNFSAEAIHCAGSPWVYGDNFRMLPTSETVDGVPRTWMTFNGNVIFNFGRLERGQKSNVNTIGLTANTQGLSVGNHTFCLSWQGAVNGPAGVGGTVFSDIQGTYCITIRVSQAPPAIPDRDATCSMSLNKSTYNPGEQIHAQFAVKNTGASTWNVVLPDGNGFIYRLGRVGQSYKDFNGNTVERIALPAQMYGGVFGDFVVQTGWTVYPAQDFTAPSSPGTYTMQWQVLQEGVVWFGQTCSAKFTINAPPPGPPTCGSFSTNPVYPESNQAFQYIMSASHTGGPLPYYLTNVALKNSAGANVVTAPPTGGNAPDSHTFSSGGLAPGVYTATWTIASGAGTVNCNGGFIVGNQPYLKVYGNDVEVGDKFAGAVGQSCDAGASRATILTLGDSDKLNGYIGSSTQLAAFALGEIDQFFSGGMQSGNYEPSSPAAGLTFGNYANGQPVGYGGRSGISHCATDYFGLLTANQAVPTGTTNNLNTNAVGAFTYVKAPSTGPLKLLSGASFDGKKVIVVDGDVYIQNNIKYQTYSSVATMPSLYLVVKGKIFIDKDVTDLSGVYVAQPGSGADSGTIYTCSTSTNYVAASNLFNDCNKKLTINGAFIAKSVKFMRTNGTKKDSVKNENWDSPHIAEVFKSSPEMYLSAPAALINASGSAGTYDSITSLPPIL